MHRKVLKIEGKVIRHDAACMQISSKGGGESTSVGKERACPLPSGIGVNSGSGVAWGEEGGEEDVTLSADSKEE